MSTDLDQVELVWGTPEERTLREYVERLSQELAAHPDEMAKWDNYLVLSSKLPIIPTVEHRFNLPPYNAQRQREAEQAVWDMMAPEIEDRPALTRPFTHLLRFLRRQLRRLRG